jgi:hypothetical protein
MLHHTINVAEAHLTDDIVSPAAVAHLPHHGGADEDFDWMREVLFEDHDVLMVFNPSRDGVDETVNGNSSLHPRDWFRPFRELRTTG